MAFVNKTFVRKKILIVVKIFALLLPCLVQNLSFCVKKMLFLKLNLKILNRYMNKNSNYALIPKFADILYNKIK